MKTKQDFPSINERPLEGVKAANNADIDVINVVDKNMYKKQELIDELSTYKMNDLSEVLKLIKLLGMFILKIYN